MRHELVAQYNTCIHDMISKRRHIRHTHPYCSDDNVHDIRRSDILRYQGTVYYVHGYIKTRDDPKQKRRITGFQIRSMCENASVDVDARELATNAEYVECIHISELDSLQYKPSYIVWVCDNDVDAIYGSNVYEASERGVIVVGREPVVQVCLQAIQGF
jgi:hypothetical protein